MVGILLPEQTFFGKFWISSFQETAQSLDEQTGKKRPLHGIPVSLKEAFNLAGNDSTAGMGPFIGILRDTDAVLVQVGLWSLPVHKEVEQVGVGQGGDMLISFVWLTE